MERDMRIRLFAHLHCKSYEKAMHAKSRGDMDEYEIFIEKARAYKLALNVMSDEDYFESLCEKFEIKQAF